LTFLLIDESSVPVANDTAGETWVADTEKNGRRFKRNESTTEATLQTTATDQWRV